MYHIRQKLNFSSPSSVVLPEIRVNENGQAAYKMVDQSQVSLPAVETTDLRAMLDAGVDIKRVNTKLFSPDSMVVDMTPDPQETSQKDGE